MGVVDELLTQRDAILFGNHVKGQPNLVGNACLAHRGTYRNEEEYRQAVLAMEDIPHFGTGCGCMSEEAYNVLGKAASDWARAVDKLRGPGTLPEVANDCWLDRTQALEVLENAIRIAKESA